MNETMVTIIGIGISVFFGLIAVIQSYRANKFARMLATEQGVFKRPDVHIKLFEKDDVSSFVLAFPLSKYKIDLPLVFSIENRGEKTANKVELFIRMANYLNSGEMAQFNITGGLLKNAKIERIPETEYVHTIGIYLDRLLPKQPIVISNDLTITQPTIIKSSVIVDTADKHRVLIPYRLEYSYTIRFTLMQDDNEPISKLFSLSFLDISDISIENFYRERNEETFRIFLKDHGISQEKKLLWFWFRIKYLYNRKPPRKFILLYPDETAMKDFAQLSTGKSDHLLYYDCFECRTGVIIPKLDIWPDLS